MKIKNVSAIRAGQFCYARIETDTGLPGIGVALVENPHKVRPPTTCTLGMDQ